MSDHALVPDRARRNLRTLLVQASAAIAVLLVAVPVVLQAVEPIADVLPDGWYAWLVATAGTLVLVATALQRILTSPVVERLLQARAPRLAATAPDGAAVITTVQPHPNLGRPYVAPFVLSPDERVDLASLRDALVEGDVGRAALDRVLSV